MTLKLRPYQDAALSDLWNWLGNNQGNPLVVLPTGAGKSLVIAEWCRLMFDVDPSSRDIVLTHVRELVAQNYAELIGLWPEAPAGIYSAGLGRRDMGARLIFASIQSVHKKAFQIQQCDLVLVDEAHLIPRSADTMYGRFLADLKSINPHMRVVGLTATPFRLDSGRLDKGEGAMFDAIAHETKVGPLFDDGYLCPPRSRRQAAQIDTSGVGIRAGEFISAQLESAAMEPEVIAAIADRVCEAGADRRGWIIFGVSVAHCEALVAALNERGFAGQGVYGDTVKTVRDRAIADFKSQRLRFLVSMGVLTTGFNAKHVDLIALARPTKSTGLYIQMVGRGTRTSPETGKTDCLILDFGGNIARHGPFDDPFIPEKKEKGEGLAPFKECPECKLAVGTMTRVCPDCGFEFPPPERVVRTIADEKPILSTQEDWVAVESVHYAIHKKEGKPDSLRVEYRCGMVTHKEWVCFDHSGYARTKAEGWWIRRAGAPVPRNTTEACECALMGELPAPTAIMVKREGQYDRVANYFFGTPQERAA
jgi:DNA repair protein RadD